MESIEVKKDNKYSYENYYKEYYRKNKEKMNRSAIEWQKREREELKKLRELQKQLKIIVN